MTEYSYEVQKLFLEMMLYDPSSFVRVQNIFNVKNFDQPLQPIAEFISTHSMKYKTLPDLVQINAVSQDVKLETLPAEINEGHMDWFFTEFEGFTRRKELERAIIKSADLLEKGEYSPVENLIKKAVQISLTKDMGVDYFEDPRTRLLNIKNNNGQRSTGWPSMDHKLYGGFNAGELQVFAGASGCVTAETLVEVIELNKHTNGTTNKSLPKKVPIASLKNKVYKKHFLVC